MSEISEDQLSALQPASKLASWEYRELFAEGVRYVFDGNRVTARFRVALNGVGRWHLWTADPGLSLLVTPDLRVRKYERIGTTCVVHLVREFDSAFDAGLKLLHDAIPDCAKHGHAWSPKEWAGYGCCWKWCLVCGEETISVGDDEWWSPAANVKETIEGAGAFPRLHGRVVGGPS